MHFRQLSRCLFAGLFSQLAVLCVGLTVLAQSDAFIEITKIEGSNFPQVVVDFKVSDGLGVPIEGLGAADFQVFEDGTKVPAGSIVVEPSRDLPQGDSLGSPISLVLAVDVSTEPADLDRIKTGLLSLVDRLRPGDQALLLAFYDEVSVAQSLTDDLNALRTAIQQLSAGGNYTALNRATIEAMNRADLIAGEQRVVVIVTDSIENINSLSASDLASRAGEVNLPIYLVAYSPKVQAPGAMEAFAQQIQARLFLVDTATEAQLRLQTLAPFLIGGGYRLRFTSALPADAAEHTISINLVGAGATGRADAILRALPGTVTIEFPDLSNGQQVSGIVTLAPHISSPGPIEQVEYVLDGESLARVESSPYTWAWDSTQIVPGSHVIGVRVEDSAGNRGEHYVTLHVADALRIDAGVTQETPYIGDTVTVVADVEAPQGVAAVEFLVDGVSAEQVSQPPYRFSFDSSGYTPGRHTVTVRASTAGGITESMDYVLDLTPAPPRFLFPQRVWLRILAFLSVVLAVVLCWLLLIYLAALGRRQRQARFRLALRNEGNVATAYLLRADEPQGVLDFNFLLDGMVLRGRQITEWVPVRSRRRSAAARPHRGAAPQERRAAEESGRRETQRQLPATQDGQAQVEGADRLQQATRSSLLVSNIAQRVGSFLSALSGFLPASLGGGALRQVTAGVDTLESQSRSVYRLNLEAGDARTALERGHSAVQGSGQGRGQVTAAGGGSGGQGTAVAAVPVGAAPPEQIQGSYVPVDYTNGYSNGRQAESNGIEPVAAAGIRYDSDGAAYKQVTRRLEDSTWTETPAVEPGDVVFMELAVAPKRARRTRVYSFRISSKAVVVADLPPVVTENEVRIRGISWLYWLLFPAFSVLVTAAIVLFMLFYLLADFGLLTLSAPDLVRGVFSLRSQ